MKNIPEMENPHITTAELDAIARLGLDDLRECFAMKPPPGSLERAKWVLRVLSAGTSRMSAENNRVATALAVAKAAKMRPEEQRVLWQQMIASGSSATKEPEALAIAESTTSDEIGVQESETGARRRRRSQKVR